MIIHWVPVIVVLILQIDKQATDTFNCNPFMKGGEEKAVEYVPYHDETELISIMQLIEKDLSEPYSSIRTATLFTAGLSCVSWPNVHPQVIE